MTKPPTASQRITREVTSWPGVAAGPGERGEFAFKIGRRGRCLPFLSCRHEAYVLSHAVGAPGLARAAP